MINNYQIKKVLGQGSFSTVSLCKDTITGNLYAIKKMKKKDLKKKKINEMYSAYDMIQQELKILKNFNHPNVLWLHEILDDSEKDDCIYLVTDYHSRGSIGDILNDINYRY